MQCPHPEKVRKENIVDALDGLIERLQQSGSHVKRTYKCVCGGWHYTSKYRPRFVDDPFPRRYLYGIVDRDDRRYYQFHEQRAAEQYAKENGGRVVPFMQSPYRERLDRERYGR